MRCRRGSEPAAKNAAEPDERRPKQTDRTLRVVLTAIEDNPPALAQRVAAETNG
jgi:hypothetical protein